MRKKRTSNALKGIASCMICAWSLCACGNVAEDSSDRKVMEESKAAEYEALFDEIEAITPYKSLSNTNPIMTQRFGADPYAMVYKDRVYFYMTGDTFEYDADGSVTENTYGKINTISVVSTTDMVNFEDHGTVYAAGSKCFLQALFPQKCRLNSSKLHGEFPQYCISSAGTLSGAGEEPLQAYKVY